MGIERFLSIVHLSNLTDVRPRLSEADKSICREKIDKLFMVNCQVISDFVTILN